VSYRGGNGPAWRIVRRAFQVIACFGALALIGILMSYAV